MFLLVLILNVNGGQSYKEISKFVYLSEKCQNKVGVAE